MLEECMLGLLEKHDDALFFILCGDLNVRTSSNMPCDLDPDSACLDMFAGNIWVEDDVNCLLFLLLLVVSALFTRYA